MNGGWVTLRHEASLRQGLALARRGSRRRLACATLLTAGIVLGGFAPGVARAADGDAEAAAPEAEAAPATPVNDQTAKLEQAVKDVEQLNYVEAQQQLLAIVSSGRANSEQLAKAYFSLGEVEAGLGNEVESTDSFYLALMIQPALLYPSGGSPKIRERLNEARSRLTEVGALEASGSVQGGALEVQIANDPLQLVKGVEVVMTRADGDIGKATLKPSATRVQVDPDVQSIRVVLHDETGNELKAFDVDPAVKSSAAPVELASKPSLWSKWGVWAGVAGALALGGTYFVVESGKLSDEVDAAKGEPVQDPNEIANLEDRRDETKLYGVVGLSMAGAAAVAAGALLFLQDDAPAKAETSSQARLVPNAGPRHVGAQFSMRF
jgi:hypothetical protein